MDLLKEILNITVIPLGFIAFLVVVPPIYVLHFLCSPLFKLLKHKENLAAKVVLITGASSGIGEALAYEYARRGARLALVARREDRLRTVLEKVLQLGAPDAIIIPADVSNIHHSHRFIHHTITHFGQLDHLVNNAGINQAKMFEELSDKLSDLSPIMDINFWGSVYATHFAVPHLKKSKGKIVVISSMAAWLPTPRLSIYNASKAALKMFFETLRAELGSDIGITIVTPGVIKSEMTPDEFMSEIKMKSSIPYESAESCAKAIVDGTCRRELYLIEPSWMRVGMWMKMYFSAALEWSLHLKTVKMPAHAHPINKNNSTN